jgi:hypothetical protein
MRQGRCAECGAEGHVQRHHVYYGRNRQVSEKYGFIALLCPECHIGTNGVHGKNGHDLDWKLKRIAQAKYEKRHTRADFIALIGRSYL